jgi:hypothetical protein
VEAVKPIGDGGPVVAASSIRQRSLTAQVVRISLVGLLLAAAAGHPRGIGSPTAVPELLPKRAGGQRGPYRRRAGRGVSRQWCHGRPTRLPDHIATSPHKLWPKLSRLIAQVCRPTIPSSPTWA